MIRMLNYTRDQLSYIPETRIVFNVTACIEFFSEFFFEPFQMGIQGLLKAVDPITTDAGLSEFAGMRVAVDGYVWLHRGVFFCASDLAKGKPNRSYISYFLNRVAQLQRYNICYWYVPFLDITFR